jgi:hypothetical protein
VSLSGSLGSFSLDEVLALLGHTGKTGALHVRDGHTEGVLYLSEGALYGAEVGDSAGPATSARALELQLVDALLVLGGLGDAAFEFETERTALFPVGDTADVETILERARVLRARWPAIQRLVPSLDAPVSIVAALRADTVSLDRSTWAVLAAIDGRRSARSIAALTDDSAFEVAAALAPLVDAGGVSIDAVVREAFDTVVAVEVQPAEPEAFEEPEHLFGDDLADAPLTEGPEALARLNRAELERAALGEPFEPFDPFDPLESVDTRAAEEVDGGAAEVDDGAAGVEMPRHEPVTVAFDAEPESGAVHDDGDPHPAIPRDRGSLLRMFSTLRDG